MFPLALLLHLHQPPTQFPEVLRLVFQQSYQPLLEFLSASPRARLTLNVTASLVEQLVALGMGEWLEELKELVAEGRVELTGTAAYHALLPKIPEEEAQRQIRLQEGALSGYLGVDISPSLCGFFPPEMGVDERVVELVGALGYRWVVVDEAAVSGRLNLQRNGLLAWEGSTLKKERGLKLVVRSKELSLRIAFGQIRTRGEFEGNLKSYFLNHTSPLVVALDGETFGHHHPKLLPFLGDLLANSGKGEYRLVTVSELIRENLPAEVRPGRMEAGPSFASVKIRSSTWSDGWERWHDPDNPIHQKQWQLTDLALRAVNESKYAKEISNLKSQISKLNRKSQISPRSKISDADLTSDLCDLRSVNPGMAVLDREQEQWCLARKLLDKALHSDQYWWASARPNWHYKMVERGARTLRDVVLTVPSAPKRDTLSAGKLYNEITRLGLEKYGDTVVA